MECKMQNTRIASCRKDSQAKEHKKIIKQIIQKNISPDFLINQFKLANKKQALIPNPSSPKSSVLMQKYLNNLDQLSSHQLQQDIKFLLSNIQARQNGLIFFLQQHLIATHTLQQLNCYQQDYLQKQKIYSNQIHHILLKYLHQSKYLSYIQHYNHLEFFYFIQNFWNNIYNIINTSFLRLNTLKLVNQNINQKYHQIISLIHYNYQSPSNLQQFYYIQNLLKKRNLDIIIHTRNHFKAIQSKVLKNRSQSAFKYERYSPKPFIYHKQIQQDDDQQYSNDDDIYQQLNPSIQLKFQHKNNKFIQARMKSLNRYRKKKINLENKNHFKSIEKKYKKISKNIDRIQKCMEGAMDGVVQVALDKKKTLKQNELQLYDTLFNKNIHNHKTISKFLYGMCGLAQFFTKKKYIKNKKLLANKLDKNIKDMDKKIKLKNLKDPKIKQKQNKDKQYRQRPQTSLPTHLKNLFQQQKKKMIQTTLILQQKKNHKFKKKITHKFDKFSKLINVAG